MRCLLRLGATGLIEVVSPFDAVTSAQLRAIRPRGEWLARRGCWEFPQEAAAALQQALAGRFPVEPQLATWLAWLEQPLPPLPPHRQLVRAADLDQPLEDGRRLLAHQRAAGRWLLARRGAVLADAMGLGKTLSALAAARAMVRLADCRILVVAPVGLHDHWRAEALALGLRLELHSWARLPPELPAAGTVLIADEAHFAQNAHTARCKALLRLARHPRLRAIWLLTGTPMKNGRPAQLFPLLAAIGHPLARHQRAYEELFCQGHWRDQGGRRVWQATGATNLAELQRLTRPLVLHRRKQDCLDLPPKQRALIPVQLEPDQALGFEQRLQRKVDAYRRRAARGEVRRDAEVLAVFTALRQIASHSKLVAARELVQRQLAAGEAVVVFTAFRTTASLLQAELGGALLTGALEPRRRQQLVDHFQEGRSPLLIATYGTGGLGFTLHRARHVVLIERPWTPGDAEQAEDRCHRIGMAGSLICHWLQLGVADQLVDGLIASKAERIAVLLGRGQQELRRRDLVAMVRDLMQNW
ncbi:DEAD/DEAH box helicase [Cyanobium sp. LEGE 06113]|jgi:SNF2 family DNA or RNA helicase|uniref:DEAD/DEAH box helicase n=1 Tax=Cyanobium sp. LEGE 06113 TaxID=1297573 RepID=UPI0018819978|nr:DEAD/DEAH box helicase [Cyanobium sp. LEGE 06113]MBE9154776.1 DEAD/DEAH box helicase [Cyanobium sp. LEGE 06113]